MTLDDPDRRPRRSLLYMPASNARAIEKARELPCDGVILDLEDSVAPEAKVEARASAMAAVRAGFGGREMVIRCNAFGTPWGAADLAAAAAAGPDVVLAPKVSSAAEVHAYDRALTSAPDRTRLWIMVETARAVLDLRELAQAAGHTRLAGMVLGPNDLCAELRLKGPIARAGLRTVLFQMTVAARAHGLVALGGTYNAIDDPQGFQAECVEEAGLGLDGKTLIHPSQIAPANAAFSPSADELAWAREVVAAFAAPEAAGKGAIRLDGRMIERLHLNEAERVLGLARP
ncbi:MAG TPA: CoA ester lyase [Caulobacteraceae bacterium]